VLHVLTPLSVLDTDGPWDERQEDNRKRKTGELLEQRYKDPPYQGIQFATVFGDPAEEISAYAKTIKADLIVLPSHGRKGLERLLIGSVAEHVCRNAPCHVLVLRS
jgi:nucleotide-binding universal stress UspA family protein